MDGLKIAGVDGRTIGQRIGRLREEMKKSQQDIADEIGESRSNIRNWEQDQRALKAETIIKLSRCLGVSADYLLGLTTERTADVNLKAVYEDTGLSEKAVSNIREIKKQGFDDGLNQILEGPHIHEVVKYAADFLRRYKYIQADNQRYWEIEDRARELQNDNPDIIVFYGRDMLEYDISESEKALRQLLLFDTGYLLSNVNEKLFEREAANGEHTED